MLLFRWGCFPYRGGCSRTALAHNTLGFHFWRGGVWLVCRVRSPLTGNLLRGREAGALEFDEDRIRSLFVTMLASKQVSMRTESVLKELLQRYLLPGSAFREVAVSIQPFVEWSTRMPFSAVQAAHLLLAGFFFCGFQFFSILPIFFLNYIAPLGGPRIKAGVDLGDRMAPRPPRPPSNFALRL